MDEKTGRSGNEILEMFGLTIDQSRLLFSTQKTVTELDFALTKNEKEADVKSGWLKQWEAGITAYLSGIAGKEESTLFRHDELSRAFAEELKKSNNRTWYYIVVLECLAYKPYTALGVEQDKQYAKCKFSDKKSKDALYAFFLAHDFLSKETLDRLLKTYNKSLNHISGGAAAFSKIAAVIAIAAVAALAAALAAGPIAVALFGAKFGGLFGAALVNACLALAGGGAIGIGGFGVAGGVAVIAGGGALLGLAGGGTAVGVASKIMLSAPEYTLTQAAKLETILKEVILNAQQDVVSAQKIIKQYQTQIDALSAQINELELKAEKNEKELKHIKTSIKYLKTSCKDMTVFASAYEIGASTAG